MNAHELHTIECNKKMQIRGCTCNHFDAHQTAWVSTDGTSTLDGVYFAKEDAGVQMYVSGLTARWMYDPSNRRLKRLLKLMQDMMAYNARREIS